MDNMPSKHCQVVILVCLLSYGGQAAAANYASLNEIVGMSLDELLDLRIDGDAVRSLAFNTPVYLDHNGEFTNFDIAATIDIIDQKTIAARGLNNVVEVAENMVGILSGESPSEPYSLSMRGFTRDTVKVLYDGIDIGTASLNMRPLSTYNLHQVEVIKGPVALQHGQGASAGSINFVNKKPLRYGDQHGSASVAYGDYGKKRLGAKFNAPWETGALRLDVYHQSADGWVEDTDASSTDIHASLLFDVTEDLDITISYSHLKDVLPAYWGTPLVPTAEALKPGDAVNSADGRVIDEQLRFTNYNVRDHVIKSSANWYRMDANWQPDNQFKNISTMYYYDAKRAWRNAESYRYDTGTQQVDRDRLSVDHDRRVWGIKNDSIWSKELFHRLNKMTLSFEYSQNQFERQVGFNQSGFVDSVDLRHPESGYFGSVSSRPDQIDIDQIALVIEDWVALTDKWHLEMGLRQEKIAVDRQRFDFDGSLREFLDDSFNLTSYRIASGYKITDHVMTYLQYSLQHDNIDGELITPMVEDLDEYEPSDTDQWELGVKAVFNDERTELAAALFQIEKKSTSFYSDVKSNSLQKSTGLELSVANQFTSRFKLGCNIAYVDARYGNYFDLGYSRDVSGNTPVNVPDTMASMWATFSHLWELPIELGAGVNYVSDRFADSNNQTILESYTLYNAFVAYNVNNLRIMLQARNLTDEVYVPWSDIFYTDQALIGPPRQIDLVATVRF